MFKHAITRQPGANYQDGLTTVDLGVPDLEKTLLEHSGYLTALKTCGLAVLELEPDLRFPDGTFVEDTAILLSDPQGTCPQGTCSSPNGGAAILTRPGAQSRLDEVSEMKDTLLAFFPEVAQISAPGTLDGGDICEAGSHFFIGISLRTNQAGAQQLAAWLVARGYSASFIDIRQVAGILHLKSGISYIGDNRLVVIDSLAGHPDFKGYELIRVVPGEEYAANCIRVNDYVLIAAGFPKFEATLRKLGYKLLVLDMSEFQKMDGGLSCLSLRF